MDRLGKARAGLGGAQRPQAPVKCAGHPRSHFGNHSLEEENIIMNTCTGCLSRNTCPSADQPMEEYIRQLPLETAHHRVATQETKCGFGLQGVCCRGARWG